MHVRKSTRKDDTVSLEIEATIDTIEEGLNRTFKQLVKTAKIPGFRPGKAPRSVFEHHYGKQALLQDGISEAINIAYGLAIQEQQLDVIDYPKDVAIDTYKDNEPLRFTCSVDVRPDIKIKDYKGIQVERESDTISDELIEAQLKQFQETGIDYAPVSRTIQREDLLKVDVTATIDGTAFSRWTKKNVGVCIGSSIFSEQFDAHLIGKSCNDEHAFSVTYNADYHLKDVAGKTVDFVTTIQEAKGKDVPELTDALVAEKSSFKTVADLRENIQHSLSKKRKEDIEKQLHTDLLDGVISNNTYPVPDAMIRTGIENDKAYFNNMLKQSGSNLNSYMAMLNQTPEQFESQLKEQVIDRLKRQFTLEGIAKNEKITVNDEEIRAEISQLRPEADTPEKIDEILKTVNYEAISNAISQKKVYAFLTKHAKIKMKTAA